MDTEEYGEYAYLGKLFAKLEEESDDEGLKGIAHTITYKVEPDTDLLSINLTEEESIRAADFFTKCFGNTYNIRNAPPDPVTAPPHYTDGGIETIDYLRAKLTPDEFKGFCKGNALKYISRAGKKGEAKQDYEKAKWYLDKLIETI